MLPYGTHHTGYTVSDLERSLDFYHGLLGLEIVGRQEKQGGYLGAIVGHPDAHVKMAHLRVPGSEHVVELFEYVAPAGTGPGRFEPPNVGTSHLCLLTDDLHALYDHLVAAGRRLLREPTGARRHRLQHGRIRAVPARSGRHSGRAVPAGSSLRPTGRERIVGEPVRFSALAGPPGEGAPPIPTGDPR